MHLLAQDKNAINGGEAQRRQGAARPEEKHHALP
jgi:hypothetical protein